MVKKFFPLFFLIFSFSFSQTVEEIKDIVKFSNQEELISYVNDAKSKGFSFNQVRELAIAQGANESELSLLENLWNDSNEKVSTNSTIIENNSENSFGNESKNISNKISDEKIKIFRFGEKFFQNLQISEAPQLYLATPDDYRLGPGDEIIINLYGASEKTYSEKISREGTIKLEKLEPIYLSGLSIEKAQSKLKLILSKIYNGLLSNDYLSQVFIDISLLKARSIVINIAGNIVAPGTYTISGFSSVLNALYAAGGPNEIGTYRNISIIRKGVTIKNIDLYKYFSKGFYPDFYLRDQDIIFIPTYEKEITLNNGFKINAKFELNNKESFSDLLFYSGGFMSNAYKDKLFVKRIVGNNITNKQIAVEDFEFQLPNDGDLVDAKFPNENQINKVEITGAVSLEGEFSLEENKTVKDLLNSAQGLLESSAGFGRIDRYKNDVLEESVSINLNDEQDLSIILKNKDELVIPFYADIIDLEKHIIVFGELNNVKNKIAYRKNLTLKDVIIECGGFKYISDKKVVVNRNISQLGTEEISETYIIEFNDDMSSEKTFYLEPYDVINVKKLEYYTDAINIEVIGEVSSEGSYSVSKKNISLKSFLEKIKILDSADKNGIYVLREGLTIPYNTKSSSLIMLESGDIINVSKFKNTIKINGEVFKNAIVPFMKNHSLNDYIEESGGFTKEAAKSKVFVNYPNGSTKKIKNFLGIKIFPSLLPGSEIIIPKKIKKERKGTAAELLSITTGITSLIALIQIINQ